MTRVAVPFWAVVGQALAQSAWRNHSGKQMKSLLKKTFSTPMVWKTMFSKIFFRKQPFRKQCLLGNNNCTPMASKTMFSKTFFRKRLRTMFSKTKSSKPCFAKHCFPKQYFEKQCFEHVREKGAADNARGRHLHQQYCQQNWPRAARVGCVVRKRLWTRRGEVSCTSTIANKSGRGKHELVAWPSAQHSPWQGVMSDVALEKGLRDRNSPICTLSQNGYGVWVRHRCCACWTHMLANHCSTRCSNGEGEFDVRQVVVRGA